MSPPVPESRISWPRLLLAVLCLAAIGGSAYYLWRHLRGGTHLEEARALLEKFDLAGAREKLLQGIEFRPDHPDLHLELGRVCRRLGLEDEARAHWRRCEELDGPAEILRLERLLLKVQRGDMGSAENELWTYVRGDYQDKDLILEALARGYLATFRLGQAMVSLDQLLQLKPRHPDALSMKGQLLTRLQQFQEARNVLVTLVEIAPEDISARQMLADNLIGLNQPTQALEHLDFVLERNPDSVPASLGRARALAQLGRHDEARVVLDALAARKALPPEGLVLRGKVEIDLDRPGTAQPWLRQAVAAVPFDREAVYNLALCLRRLDRPEEAKKWFARYEDIDTKQKRLAKITTKILAEPADADLRFQAGEIFLETGQAKEGLRWLFSALQEDPRHVPTHRLLSRHYRDAGRPDLAETHARLAEKK